jgi:hypothetical protein
MGEIIWRMSSEVAEQYKELVEDYENPDEEFDEREFADQLMTLPGYPLNRAPAPGDHLRIVVLPKIYGLTRAEKAKPN